MDTTTPPVVSIGIDIGKEVFHVVGFGADGKIGFRRKISDVYLKRLSAIAGLSRVSLTIARVPPGKESFLYRRHERDEEFIFILLGRGRAEIGDENFDVGPGDFMGFPAPDGRAHHLTNPYDDDESMPQRPQGGGGGEAKNIGQPHAPDLQDHARQQVALQSSSISFSHDRVMRAAIRNSVIVLR
jgi:uncharacterized cupin superfamily protein